MTHAMRPSEAGDSSIGDSTRVERPTGLVPREEPSLRESIGRYKLLRVLGRGGFGIVYLAFDPQLDRQVALKVPRPGKFTTPVQLESFLQEAQTAAKLKHPALVGVYDIQTHDGVPVIVQEYVEGLNLGEWATQHQPSYERIGRIFVDVCEVLTYVHQQGLTHCDLKLANLLVDVSEKVFVADFGLAIHESARALRKGEILGTPAMMAPEQVRGETHRLDGRTDIWSLGVILYELLAGCRPFRATSVVELYAEILTSDPRPLREIKSDVPWELDRICCKCLQKRRSYRYASATDLRDDLLTWLNDKSAAQAASTTVVMDGCQHSESSLAAQIIPKGLRSFDAEDADFFLGLLPGPRDRDGLPEMVRFWKNRIESVDARTTFSVGVMYGPSGCGKSSLVKAGLLPRLSPKVIPIYLEATAEDTERQLLHRLRKLNPRIAPDATLADACAELRAEASEQRPKVLVVIDQFEQWLHVHTDLRTSQLVDALRQSNGRQLQVLLLVRDDFYLSVNRLFQELEIPLVEGVNQGVVDFFDQDHARRVLAAFGRAHGKLGDSLSAEQEEFLARAVNDLAEDDKVICVRLALFADLMKSRPWRLASLKKVGGVAGLGVTFLDETFCAATAPPAHRYHQDAARAVLKALLSESGSQIRARTRTRDSLFLVSTYAKRPADFEDLLRILDSELRLITPTGPSASVSDTANAADTSSPPPDQRSYQLTHDYLVPPLRAWLDLNDERSRSGRATRRLRRRSENWQASPENRQLPSLMEAIAIEWFTSRTSWTKPERLMMRKTWRYHVSRAAMTLAPVLILGFALTAWLSIQSQIGRLLDASAPSVPQMVEGLRSQRLLVQGSLRRKALDASQNPVKRLRAAYALAAFGAPETDLVVQQMAAAPPEERANIDAALRSDVAYARRALLKRFAQLDARQPSEQHARAVTAIVALGLGEPEAAIEMSRVKVAPDRALFIEYLSKWLTADNAIAEILEQPAEQELCSALCAGLGDIELGSLPPNAAARMRSAVQGNFRRAADIGTHSAARYALQKWNDALPAIESATGEREQQAWRVNSQQMTLLKIPAGTLRRNPSDGAATDVVIESFWISDCEVTCAAFQQFLKQERDSYNWSLDVKVSPSEDHPVNNVSWEDAVRFLNWLSRQEALPEFYESVGEGWSIPDPDGEGYRLPTEAEWEYACRCGSPGAYSFGDSAELLPRYAVFGDKYQTEIGGSRLPNGWGLFDMHGNLWEWCEDAWAAEPVESQHDDTAFASADSRVMRGGAYDNPAGVLRAAHRQGLNALGRLNGVGFRAARSANSPSR